MCGILGALRFGELNDSTNEEHNWMRKASLLIAAGILEKTEKRGKDATGISALFNDGRFILQKMGTDAKTFMSRFGGKKEDFQGFMKILREYESTLKIITGHCRKKSVGGSFDNVNNHPVKANKIVGLHNGTLKNQNIIFENLKCKRDGDVDSEAIFRLLDYYTKGGKEPFTMEMVEDTFNRLEGTFSIIAYNIDNPNQVVVGRDGRPAEFCLVKPLKTVFIASEKAYIEHALWRYNQTAALFYDGQYPRIKSADAVFKTLIDDTAGIFDLTKEIDENSEMADLLDTKKLPLTSQRIWKVPVKSTVYPNDAYRNRQQTDDKKKVTVGGQGEPLNTAASDKSMTGTTKTKDAAESRRRFVARVWNEDLNKFIPKTDIKAMESTQVINLEKKTINDLTSVFREVTKEQNDPFNKSEQNALVEKKFTHEVEEYKSGKTAVLNNIIPIEAKALEVEVNQLKVIKEKTASARLESKDHLDGLKATIQASKELLRLDTIDEVAELLNADVENIEKLSLPAITNRLLKAQFSKMFLTGWMAKCDALKTQTIDKHIEAIDKHVEEEKEVKSRKHIRVLKHIVNALGQYDEKQLVSEWAKKWATSYSEINTETLSAVFNEGDLRDNDKVTEIMKYVKK